MNVSATTNGEVRNYVSINPVGADVYLTYVDQFGTLKLTKTMYSTSGITIGESATVN